MSKKAFLATLATVLAWLGVLVIVTGIIKDEKSLYALAAVCMIFSSILLLLVSRPHIRLGP